MINRVRPGPGPGRIRARKKIIRPGPGRVRVGSGSKNPWTRRALADIRPFEHEFFQIISQSFSLLKTLIIFNNERQNTKQQSRRLITFPKLFYLDISDAHIDYLEQFLFDQYCHLPCLLTLVVNYASLVSVTNYFTNDSTRLTCSKLKHLRINEPFIRPEHFHQYFSSL